MNIFINYLLILDIIKLPNFVLSYKYFVLFMCMSSNDYSVQNIHRYSRKSYKKNGLSSAESYLVSARDDINTGVSGTSQKNERFTVATAGCSCDVDEGELVNILHRKCPVIALAQQQLQKLLNETDALLCDNTKCCRSVFDLIQICKDAIWSGNRCKCGAVVILFCIFMIGLLLGAATCGVSYRKFNSPIFTCIDSYFIPETYTKLEDTYRSIV